MSRQQKPRQKSSASRRNGRASLAHINLDAAGLDIGAAEIWACVPEARDDVSVRRFDTFTPDLQALADWLVACGITTVAMESTGIYWLPITKWGVAHLRDSRRARARSLLGQRPHDQERLRPQE